MPQNAGRARTPRLRMALLLAVVAAVGVLLAVVVVVGGARRSTFFPEQPGRTAAPGEPAWTRGAAAPVSLTEVAAAAHRGRIWVAGGMDAGGQAVDRVLVYDPVADAWSDGPSLPEPVHHAALVSDGDALLLIGGYVGGGPTDAVWRLEDGGVWTRHPPLRAPRGAGAAAWNGRGLVMYGGGVGPDGVSADVFVQDDHGWRLLDSLSRPREHLAAASSGSGSVTFLGGRVGGLDGNLGTVDLVSGEGVVGRTDDVPTPRGGIAAFSAGELGDCVVGGEGPHGTFAVVECVGVTATSTLPGLTVPRHGLGAAFLDGRAYVLLGGPQPGLTVSDVVEVLDLR